MNDILIIVQARLSSSRLPGKVLKKILGKPMLEHQLQRLSHVSTPHRLIVATSENREDEAIATLCEQLNIDCYRGDLDDVLARYYQAAMSVNDHNNVKHIVRITGDCPLIDAEIIDKVISLYLHKEVDYCSNCAPATLPDGLDVEIFKLSALKLAHEKAIKPSEREHVTLFIRNNPNMFTCENFTYKKDLSHLRWTVDEPEDFDFVTQVYQNLYQHKANFMLKEVLSLLESKPSLKKINSQFIRNEGLILSQNKDKESGYE